MKKEYPPDWAIKFLRWYCRPDLVDEIEGDLLEEFKERAIRKSLRFARWYYVLEILRFFRPFTLRKRTLYHSPLMLQNYLLIAWRAFLKNKTYSVLNIFGLTIGISCAIVICLYVQDELAYDHHHTNLENIYRLNSAYHLPNNSGREDYAVSGPLVGEVLVKDFPEIKQMVRLRKLQNIALQEVTSGNRYYEEVIAADSNVFQLFTFPFISGDPQKALIDLNSVVISRKAAMKFFNSSDVIGKSIRIHKDSIDLKITGVFENPPLNTQFKFDYIISMETFKSQYTGHFSSWWNYEFYTYLELQPLVDVKSLESKIKFISRKYIANSEDASGYRQEYSLVPLSQVHLHSSLRREIEANGNVTYIYMFLIIAVFIIVIACINFMNLATARSAMRAKEIGLRKVVGALRSQLISQFLGESFLMTFLSVILSIGLSLFLIPIINDFLGKGLHLISTWDSWLLIGGIIVFVGLLAGSYPSLFLSAFKPVETLKGDFKSSSKGNVLRKALVVFQFSISTFLIAGTIIIYNQLTFIRSVNLGFDNERIIFIPTREMPDSRKEFEILKHELEKLSGVDKVTLSSQVPGMEMDNSVVRIGWDDKAPLNDMRYLTVDHDFAKTYNIKVSEGRFFDPNYPSDKNSAFLVNESGMRRLGWTDPKEAIGKELTWMSRKGQVIGVLKDFHFMAANVPVEPFLVVMNTSRVNYLSLKISSGDPSKIISQIENVFSATLPSQIFEYQFLDEDFDKQYKAEDQFMTVFTSFAIVAIIIACLGLYGLAMFVSELRLKEVTIRKILGASEASLAQLFTKDFLILLLVSFIIALPVSYLIMNEWLSSFPLRKEINPLILSVSTGVTIIIALSTISFQVVKIMRTNPTETLR